MTYVLNAVSAYSNSVTYALPVGTLPSGLSLSTSGGISGTPSTIASGLYTFTISAADSYTSVNRVFAMNATARTVTWSTVGNVGTYVQQTAVNIPLVSTSSINANISYSVTAGTLPSGLSLVSNAISGVLPSAASNTTYNFSVTATDGVVSTVLPISLYSVPNSGTDLYASNVVCLMHFDNGSFQDSMGHPTYNTGIPVITSNGVGAYNSSLYLNGTNQVNVLALNGDFDLGNNNSGDFTIEVSVMFTSFYANVANPIVGKWGYTSGQNSWMLLGNAVGFTVFCSGANILGTYPTSLTTNTWYNVAISHVKSTNTWYCFLNGNQVGTGIVNSNYPGGYPLQPMVIGGYSDLNTPGVVGPRMSGYVDEVRITNGKARYTANYTVSLPFPTPSTFQTALANTAISNAIAVIGGGSMLINAVTVYGSQPLTYSLVSGTLPVGLTVNSSTGVTGTTSNPASTTNYTFTLSATDSYTTVARQFLANVIHAVTPVWVTNSGSLGTQIQGEQFSATLNAVANAIVLTTSGQVSAYPNYQIGTFSSTAGLCAGMTVIGNSVPANTTIYSFSNNNTLINLSQVIPALPSGTSLNFTPTSVSYAVTTGALPVGLVLNSATGVISGFMGGVSTNTTTNFSVTASTIPSQTVTQSFSITTLASQSTDPYIANVVFESYFDGSNNGTLISDSVGHIMNAVVNLNGSGYPYISTAKFLEGGSSLYCNGGSAIQFAPFSNSSTEFQFGSNNFTIEFAVNFSNNNNNQTVLGQCTTSQFSWAISFNPSGALYFYAFTSGTGGSTTFGFTYTFTINTWYEIALCRSGTSLNLFVNGVYQSAVNIGTTVLYQGSSSLWIGGYNPNNQTWYFTGYLDSVRITNGVARYTAGTNYTPQLSPFQPVGFITPAGSLGTQAQNSAFGVYVVATSQFDYDITYSVNSGNLPSGLTLDAPTGYISGVLPSVSNNTTSTFTIAASDGYDVALQTFSITDAQTALTDNVASLVVTKIHFDGAPGATSFTDVIGHTIYKVFNNPPGPYVSTAIRYAGSGSMYLDGISDYILIGNPNGQESYTEFTLGTNDFTFEMSIYFANSVTAAEYPLFTQGSNFGIVYQTGEIYFTLNGGGTLGTIKFPWLPITNVWYPLAFVRSNGNVYAFVNGVSLGTAQALGNVTGSTTSPFAIGYFNSSSYIIPPCYIDEVRITIGAIASGAARYTSNYTPAVQPFP